MDSSLIQSEVATALLRSLAKTDTNAWCFVPVGSSRPVWQSRAWHQQSHSGSPADQAVDSANAGGDVDQSLQELLESGQATGTIALRDGDWSFRVTSVLDAARQPIGSLVRFYRQADLSQPLDLISASHEARRRLASLSPREIDVLELVYEGLTNKAIAARSHISQKTVEKHRGRISRKLQTASIAELVRLVATARLTEEHGAVTTADCVHD